MKKVLIFGAGSIGNHLANASRKCNLNVSVVDISSEALKRMKNVVYPSRYKKWDQNIKFLNYKDIFESNENYHLIIVGTPPETHLELLSKIKNKLNYKKILIEKPLTTFNEKNTNFSKSVKEKNIYVGYNHSVSKSFLYFCNLIKKKIKTNEISCLEINWREGWTGILNAHFWLKNEFNSYLGDIKRGGGSLHEHSHGLHLIICLEKILNFKLPKKFNLNICYKKNKSQKIYYDNFANINWRVNNFIINYTTDLISEPAEKSIKIYTKNKIYVLIFNYQKKSDKIEIQDKNISSKKKVILFKKKRSTDFINEIKHLTNMNSKNLYKKSFLKLENSLRVQSILSNALKK